MDIPHQFKVGQDESWKAEFFLFSFPSQRFKARALEAENRLEKDLDFRSCSSSLISALVKDDNDDEYARASSLFFLFFRPFSSSISTIMSLFFTLYTRTGYFTVSRKRL